MKIFLLLELLLGFTGTWGGGGASLGDRLPSHLEHEGQQGNIGALVPGHMCA